MTSDFFSGTVKDALGSYTLPFYLTSLMFAGATTVMTSRPFAQQSTSSTSRLNKSCLCCTVDLIQVPFSCERSRSICSNLLWVRSFSFPGSTPAVRTRVSPGQELIERSHSLSRGDGMHLRSPPSDPLHKQGTGGWPRWAPSKLFERTGADRGRPREAKRTHPLKQHVAYTVQCALAVKMC